MADILIAHLREKGAEHSATKALINQWGFDEQLIPKALHAIGNMFPHYSRHDESHSKQILTNIERILGKNIELLSATDTWLLIEAAYWHDIGMVVKKDEVEKALKETSFLDFLDELRRTSSNDLHKFAKNFDHINPFACFSAADSPMEATEQFRLLMAEWFRRQHPVRAEKIVKSPLESLGLSSPRTELIPKRLFRVLSKICFMHGAPFNDLMSDAVMPFREAGMAGEDCHPRYVACLLRLGDLLDIDDNRFCPVMQGIAGENRPRLTKAHEDKHAGLRHLRLDPNRIELAAECDEIDGYVETFKWFEWIRKEIENQGTRWADIVPSRELGLLPTLGQTSVKLSGKFQLPAEGKRPQFSLDSEQVTRLLQGSQIYSSKFSCIREILQNSVDATLLRLWVTNRAAQASGVFKNPLDTKTQTKLSSLPITINLELLEADSSAETTRWRVRVTDQGIGISRDDIVHMLRIGGSKSNQHRRAIIRNMPDWMKPSGTFGIGFQSIYMLATEVSIETKSIFSNDIIRAVLFDPRGDHDGLALVETLQQDISRDYGTSIEFVIETSRDERFEVNLSRAEDISHQIFYSMDPVLDEYRDFSIGEVADEIHEFSRNSLIPVYGHLSDTYRSYSLGVEKINATKTADDENWEFLKVGGQELKIRFTPHQNGLQARSLDAFYRGQRFETYFMIPFGSAEVDLMSGDAGEWLSVSRDRLTAQSKKRFYDLVLEAIACFIEMQLDQGSESRYNRDPAIRAGASAFIETLRPTRSQQWALISSRLDKAWQEILPKNDDKPLHSILEGGGGYVSAFNETLVDREREMRICDKKVILVLRDLLPMLVDAWSKRGGHVQAVLGEVSQTLTPIAHNNSQAARYAKIQQFMDSKRIAYRLCAEVTPPFNADALAAILIKKAYSGHFNARYLIPNDGRWNKLSLRNDITLFADRLFRASPSVDLILVPYLFKKQPVLLEATSDQLDKLAIWLQPRLKLSQSRQQIRDECDKLLDYIDKEILDTHSGEGWVKLERVRR